MDRYNYGYYYNKITGNFELIDYTENGMMITNTYESNEHTFLVNGEVKGFDKDGNLLTFATEFDNVSQSILDSGNNYYVYFDNYFVKADYFDSLNNLFELTIEGNRGIYCPIKRQGLVKGELVEITDGVNFFKFESSILESQHECFYAIRAGYENEWYLAKINETSNGNFLQYYFEKNDNSQTAIWNVILVKDGSKYKLVFEEPGRVNIYNENVEIFDGSTTNFFDVYSKTNRTIKNEELGITLNIYNQIEDNVIIYNHQYFDEYTVDRGLFILNDGTILAFVNKYGVAKGYARVTKSSLYKDLYDVVYMRNDGPIRFYGAYVDYNYSLSNSGDILVTYDTVTYDENKNYYRLGFSYFVPFGDILISTNKKGIDSGSFIITQATSMYKDYTVTFDSNTKTWTLTPPIE